jgi:hypothetical protein
MAEEIITHGLIAEAKTGQNGGLNPSVIKTGEKLPRSTVAKSIIAADGSVSANPGDWQTRNVSAAPINANPGTKGPSTGAKVPLSTVRRANDGLIRPTRR